jgi:hypothetical protein
MAPPTRRHTLGCLLLVSALLAIHWASELIGDRVPPVALAASPAVSPSLAAQYFLAYVLRAVHVILPGALVICAGNQLYKRQATLSKPVLGVASTALVFLFLAAPLALDAQFGAATPHQPEPSASSAPMPHSGELRLGSQGAFVTVPDPRDPEGKSDGIQQGWQQALWTSMTQAIQAGEEQVVMVFSREGCPWCDRLLPVLEKAIATRAAIESPGAGGLASAPLRVFIYDAGEFGPIVEKFQLQGFPSMLVFGGPGVKPRMAAGYLGDEDFARFLDEVARAQPEPEVAPEPKKRKFFGLR